jgi:hypothetical protein
MLAEVALLLDLSRVFFGSLRRLLSAWMSAES